MRVLRFFAAGLTAVLILAAPAAVGFCPAYAKTANTAASARVQQSGFKITAFGTNIRFVATPVLYPDGKNSLTFSYAFKTAAKASLQICAGGKWYTIHTATKAVKNGSFSWKGHLGEKKLAAGNYTVRVYAVYNGKAYTKTLTLRILAKPPVWNVFLSPSMQAQNVGAGNYGTEEQRMNQVADVVQRELAAHGITVYRNKPSWTLKQAVAYANGKACQAYVAIHSNASTKTKDKGKVSGCEVWTKQAGSAGEYLADEIYSNMAALTPEKDRGVKYRDLYETTQPKAPSCLVEVDFHDNPASAKWIIKNIENIGKSIAKGICADLNVRW